jgi:hypothetical protein
MTRDETIKLAVKSLLEVSFFVFDPEVWFWKN